MKKILSIALFASALAASAHAVIVGASIGYLTDGEDTYFAARAGGVFSSSDSISHILEFEVGYTSDSEGGVDGSILPVTLNYRADFARGQKVGYYVGGGAGMARTKVSGFGISENDWSFAMQGFAGVSMRVSERSSINLGARYIWLDDITLLGESISLGDDLAIEAGFQIRF
ncbi:MAG TPA: outer membrane beta-barrel protein [Opitutaceae bacterium]|nr:outer membrane beta-barrel protein [Opitutaceae bacterium]